MCPERKCWWFCWLFYCFKNFIFSFLKKLRVLRSKILQLNIRIFKNILSQTCQFCVSYYNLHAYSLSNLFVQSCQLLRSNESYLKSEFDAITNGRVRTLPRLVCASLSSLVCLCHCPIVRRRLVDRIQLFVLAFCFLWTYIVVSA